MTMKEIAMLAGVSPATVSLVLNNRPGVNEHTRATIASLLKKHGYSIRQDSSAASRRNILYIRFRGTGHLFEAVDDFYERVFDGADCAAKELGYTLTVTNADLYSLPNLLEGAGPDAFDGILFFASEFDPIHSNILLKARIPLVVIDSRLTQYGINTVTVEAMFSVYQALNHLRELGHQRIGFLAADESTGALPERQRAFYQQVSTLGFELREQDILTLPIFVEPACQAFQKYLKASSDFPTAFFACNDIMAAGVLKAIHQSNFRVPEDFSIIGFDDSLVCTLFSPALTTVRIPKKKIGSLSVNRLHEIINGDTAITVSLVTSELVIRESTSSPKK